MLKLKPWTELPTPRHLLDECDDIDEKEAQFLLQYESWSRVMINKEIGDVDTLAVFAPRLSRFSTLNGDFELVGEIETGTTKTPIKHEHSMHVGTSSEFYEFDDSNDQNQNEKVDQVLVRSKLRYNSKQRLLIACLNAPLESRDCFEFAKEIITKFQPSNVRLFCCTDMNSTMQDLYLLTANEQNNTGLPLLPPPFMLRGVIASIMSQCVKQNINCLSIVVRAEGPEGHEAVDFEQVTPQLSHSISSILNIENIKVKEDHDHGLFI